MEEYLTDRETLEKFIDELLKQKPLPAETAEDLNRLREEKIRELDDKIGTAIFGNFTKEQALEYDQILDQEEDTPELYEQFFEKNGIDIKEIITKTMEDFAREFLGGNNE